MHLTDVLYEVADGVARITINRSEKYNAFREETLDDLIAAFSAAEADRTVGVIVLTGAGDKAFCSGGDIAWEDASDPVGAARMNRRTSNLSLIMRGCGKPIIARVNRALVHPGHRNPAEQMVRGLVRFGRSRVAGGERRPLPGEQLAQVISVDHPPRLDRHGVSRCRSRGNIVTSRTLPTSSRRIMNRSRPMAKPPCGGMPCRKTSR